MDRPEPPDLTLILPLDVYYLVIHTLCGSLPPPPTSAPEDRVRRDNAAIAQVAALLPADADEANLAATYVAANAQAMESLRLAREYPGDPNVILKCTAQAASMMRQARGTRSLLLRVQAERRKREADNTGTDKAAWIEHCAIGLMADALGRTPPSPMAEPPPPCAPVDETETPFEQLTEADQYAIIYPRRAALIRSLGGLPARCDFGPPEPDLAHAIVSSTSPILRALDAPAKASAAAAM
jgi:hypothetical protein